MEGDVLFFFNIFFSSTLKWFFSTRNGFLLPQTLADVITDSGGCRPLNHGENVFQIYLFHLTKKTFPTPSFFRPVRPKKTSPREKKNPIRRKKKTRKKREKLFSSWVVKFEEKKIRYQRINTNRKHGKNAVQYFFIALKKKVLYLSSCRLKQRRNKRNLLTENSFFFRKKKNEKRTAFGRMAKRETKFAKRKNKKKKQTKKMRT